MKSRDLPNRVYVFVSDSQELECLCAFLGIVDFADEITGALVSTRDGDYSDVYLTDSSRPYDVNCEWYCHEYFDDYVPSELDLQDVSDDQA